MRIRRQRNQSLGRSESLAGTGGEKNQGWSGGSSAIRVFRVALQAPTVRSKMARARYVLFAMSGPSAAATGSGSSTPIHHVVKLATHESPSLVRLVHHVPHRLHHPNPPCPGPRIALEVEFAPANPNARNEADLGIEVVSQIGTLGVDAP